MKPTEMQLPLAGKREAVTKVSEGVQTDTDSTSQAAICPLACSRPDACPWRCPTRIDVALAELLEDVARAARRHLVVVR